MVSLCNHRHGCQPGRRSDRLWHKGRFKVFATEYLKFDPDFAIHSNALGIHTTIGAALTENFWMLALLCSILRRPTRWWQLAAVWSGWPSEFMLASAFGRTLRFFGVSGAFAFFGEKARRWIRV